MKKNNLHLKKKNTLKFEEKINKITVFLHLALIVFLKFIFWDPEEK